MANFTKKAIKETFLNLLEERPLSEITVKDIVETCGINRNSFYYHYQDLPSLLEEIVREEAEDMIRKYPNVSSSVECYDALIEFVSHRRRAIMHIYRSVSRESFENSLMQLSEYFVRSYANTALKDFNIPAESRQAIIDYYKCACFGLVIDWLNTGMSAERAQSIRQIFLLRRNAVEEIAKLLHEGQEKADREEQEYGEPK